MSDYKSAFNAMAADIGAIIALLGFDKYPGVDPVLRAITDLVLAKAEVQQLKRECDAALAANAQMHSMLGVTDQVQAGERIGFLVGQSIMVPKLEARLAALEKQEPLAWVDADWIAQVSDPRGAGCTVRRAYGSASADLAPVYAAPVAQAGQVPEGWKLVPLVPTQEMHDAGRAVLENGAHVPMAKVFQAMIAAAPAQGGSTDE